MHFKVNHLKPNLTEQFGRHNNNVIQKKNKKGHQRNLK